MLSLEAKKIIQQVLGYQISLETAAKSVKSSLNAHLLKELNATIVACSDCGCWTYVKDIDCGICSFCRIDFWE